MPRRTKIICTIGPSVNSLDKVMELMKAGMNVARLNFSHGTQEEHLVTINMLKEARRLLEQPLAILLDTKGPELRLGKIKDGQITLKAGHHWFLSREEIEGNEQHVYINPSYILDNITVGTRILFDDGYVSSHVIEIKPEGVLVQIDNDGILKTGKGINIPYVDLHLPAVTEQDISDIRFGCHHDVDIIAASFVRSADHVLAIRKLLNQEKKPEILIIAKIENNEGVQNFDHIVQIADGIMIARGDLGVEVPLSEVPKLQKMMIRKCYLAGKPSVTATQMLESMIKNPRPTRAEVSDVANAIYDSTSAVMLSGETAVGQYPIETVRLMTQIISEAEQDFDYLTFFNIHASLVYHDVPSAVTLATVKTAYSSHAKAVFALTKSGATARLLSRLRPAMPIIAMTQDEQTYHRMAFNWGVIPFLGDEGNSVAEAFNFISHFALSQSLVSYGDLVVVTAGSPFGISGTTNMMIVESIGDVLVRGDHGFGPRIYGNVIFALTPDGMKPYSVANQILVITKCDETYSPLIQQASGVILQNHINDFESERFLLSLIQETNKPILIRADGATNTLKEGQLVTLDPEKALVYKGVVI